ncbi:MULTISPECIES: hypothetical protein [unclassified Nocardioides]|uniref:hypothetical protein n=1 Tax=unclassified Nocardioides TaxID=2615069 RepID=UPI0006F5719F|nr:MULTISPECIES: hypothetical protein [unclassified Nocardioides]KRA31180.1 hypothetical protein ASD81_17055 [Nocardioides sp. Root614]KRA87800.1 hypothetical protein ASD84_17325 [Nocardioides sp. Root682]
MKLRGLTAALAGVLAALLCSCSLVEEPDAAAWDQQAAQALEDAASEVATTRLALETAAQERVWSSYTTVVVADAEEAIVTVADNLARVQAPAGRTEQAADVGALMDRAVASVRAARSLAVQGRYDDPASIDELDRLATDLEDAAGAR